MRRKCEMCLKFKVLNKNKKCRRCNEQRGIKQCPDCGTIQLLDLAFSDRLRKCNSCTKKYYDKNRKKRLLYQENYRKCYSVKCPSNPGTAE